MLSVEEENSGQVLGPDRSHTAAWRNGPITTANVVVTSCLKDRGHDIAGY